MTESDTDPNPPIQELSLAERAIVVRALGLMSENDAAAAPSTARATLGHISLGRAMREARGRGAGSRATLDFDALGIVYEVLGPRATRLTVTRKTVAAPYPGDDFSKMIKGWPVRMKDGGDGSYVFEIEHPYSDGEALANIAKMLEMGSADAEDRKLGVLPPLED